MCLSIAIDRPDDVLAKGEHLGYQWMIIHNRMGYRCGYVRLPSGHVWHGKTDWYWDDDAAVAVHGGITFSEPDVPCNDPGPDTDWWIGFDCAHAYDRPDPSLPRHSKIPFLDLGIGTIPSQSFVLQQCHLLCEQAQSAAQ